VGRLAAKPRARRQRRDAVLRALPHRRASGRQQSQRLTLQPIGGPQLRAERAHKSAADAGGGAGRRRDAPATRVEADIAGMAGRGRQRCRKDGYGSARCTPMTVALNTAEPMRLTTPKTTQPT